MTRSARSVFVFSVYLLVLGPVLLAAPNVLLAVFGVPGTEEVWIRVVGMLVTILGYYYLQAARNGLTAFFRATVHGRAAVLAFFVAFVVLRLAPPQLGGFGAVDVAGAVWTGLLLRAEAAA